MQTCLYHEKITIFPRSAESCAFLHQNVLKYLSRKFVQCFSVVYERFLKPRLITRIVICYLEMACEHNSET